MNSLSRRQFLKYASILPLYAFNTSPMGRVLRKVNQGQKIDKPNVIIIVFDSLSALHTSLNGYHRDTTPNFARFAEHATIFHKHYAGGSFTTPGTASLLTGTLPWTHRAIQISTEVAESMVPGIMFSALDDSYTRSVYTHNPNVSVLFNQFRDHIDNWKKMEELCLYDTRFLEKFFPADYYTALGGDAYTYRVLQKQGTLSFSLAAKVIDKLTGRLLKTQYGDQFPMGMPRGSHLAATYYLLEDVIDWLLSDLPTLQLPFLSYTHVYPPHEPYAPRREFIGMFSDDWKPIEKAKFYYSGNTPQETLNQRRLEYDEYLAYADAEFGRLYDSLLGSGLLDNTYLVLTSDHGQMFERGIHGHWTRALYEEIINVPLVISRPGQTERQDILTPTSCIDLLPTLLHIMGQTIPDWCEGQILPSFSSDSVQEDRQIFVIEGKTNPRFAPLNDGTVVLIMGNKKLIRYLGGKEIPEGYELYDLESDPEEINNLYQSNQSLAKELQSILDKAIEDSNSRLPN